MPNTWTISAHAFERYRQRYARNLSEDEARAALLALIAKSHYVKDLYEEIHLYRAKYKAPSGKQNPIQFVVSSRQPDLILVTVLKPGEKIGYKSRKPPC